MQESTACAFFNFRFESHPAEEEMDSFFLFVPVSMGIYVGP